MCFKGYKQCGCNYCKMQQGNNYGMHHEGCMNYQNQCMNKMPCMYDNDMQMQKYNVNYNMTKIKYMED